MGSQMTAKQTRNRAGWLMLTLLVSLTACAETDNDDLGGQESANIEPSERGILMHFENPFANTSSQRSLCVRGIAPPGKVQWEISNPAGIGYSVKPENASTLIWAKAPEQSIDAIYRHTWGCGIALKVPSHCTATVSSAGISCCCNDFASIFKGVCRWVSTLEGEAATFADCPL